MSSADNPHRPNQPGIRPRHAPDGSSPTADTKRCGMDNGRQKSWSGEVKLRGYRRFQGMRKRRLIPQLGHLALRTHREGSLSQNRPSTSIKLRDHAAAPTTPSTLKGGQP